MKLDRKGIKGEDFDRGAQFISGTLVQIEMVCDEKWGQ